MAQPSGGIGGLVPSSREDVSVEPSWFVQKQFRSQKPSKYTVDRAMWILSKDDMSRKVALLASAALQWPALAEAIATRSRDARRSVERRGNTSRRVLKDRENRQKETEEEAKRRRERRKQTSGRGKKSPVVPSSHRKQTSGRGKESPVVPSSRRKQTSGRGKKSPVVPSLR